MDRKKLVLFCFIISFFSLFSSLYAIKWNGLFVKDTILDLYTYNEKTNEMYEEISSKFSSIHSNIKLNIVFKPEEKPIIGIKIDDEGLPSFNTTNNSMVPICFDGLGLTYDKSFFTELGIKKPETFRELENLCKILYKKSFVPFDRVPEKIPETFKKFVKANTRKIGGAEKSVFQFVSFKDFCENGEKYSGQGFMCLPISNDINKNNLYAKVDAAIAIFDNSDEKVKNAGEVFIKWLNISGNI